VATIGDDGIEEKRRRVRSKIKENSKGEQYSQKYTDDWTS